MCSWHPVQKIKKADRNFQTPLSKKRWILPHEKRYFLLEHGSFRERDNKPHLELYMKRLMSPTYRMMLRVLGFGGWMTDFGLLELIAALWLFVVFREAYVQHRHTSILISINRHAFYLVPCGI
jgi:hypothetical protein